MMKDINLEVQETQKTPSKKKQETTPMYIMEKTAAKDRVSQKSLNMVREDTLPPKEQQCDSQYLTRNNWNQKAMEFIFNIL